MVLIVVGGGAGTLKTVLSVLESSRPVVVLVNSGGAAHEIYEYVRDGRLPEMTLAEDDKMYRARKAYCEETAPKMMPKVRDLGSRQQGIYNAPLLTFFGESDLVQDEMGVVRYETDFADFVRKVYGMHGRTAASTYEAPSALALGLQSWSSAAPPSPRRRVNCSHADPPSWYVRTHSGGPLGCISGDALQL